MLRVLFKVGDHAARMLEVGVALAFIGAVLLNFSNVIYRYGFGGTFSGADEVQIYVMAAMTFIGAGIVAWRNAHLRMSVVVDLMPVWCRILLLWGEYAVAILVSGLFVYVAWLYVRRIYSLGMVSDAAGVPLWIPHGVVLVGFTLVLLSYLIRVFVRR